MCLWTGLILNPSGDGCGGYVVGDWLGAKEVGGGGTLGSDVTLDLEEWNLKVWCRTTLVGAGLALQVLSHSISGEIGPGGWKFVSPQYFCKTRRFMQKKIW